MEKKQNLKNLPRFYKVPQNQRSLKEMQEVLQSFLKSQQSLQVVRDPVHRIVQDITTSDVPSSVSQDNKFPQIVLTHVEKVPVTEKTVENSSTERTVWNYGPGTLLLIPNAAQSDQISTFFIPRAVVKDTHALPKAVENYRTQADLNDDPYTLPKVASADTYTLPEIHGADTYFFPKLSDGCCPTLPVVSNTVLKSSKIQTMSSNVNPNSSVVSAAVKDPSKVQKNSNVLIHSNSDVVSTAVNDTIKAQPFSKTNSMLKTFHDAEFSESTIKNSLPFYDDNSVQKIDSEQFLKQVNIKGRRIIEFDYFFKQLKDVNQHSKSGCNLNDIIITAERKRGISTSYQLTCTSCDFQKVLWSECQNKKSINHVFISAMLKINCSFKTINKVLSKMNLPTLGYSLLRKHRARLQNKHQAKSKHSNLFGTPYKISFLGKTLESGLQTAALQSFTMPQKTYEKASRKLGSISESKPQSASPQTCEKTSEKLRTTFELKRKIDTHQTFNVSKKTFEKSSQKSVNISELRPQYATHEMCEKTSQKFGTTVQLKPQSATYQLFTFPMKTFQKTSQKFVNISELRPQPTSTHEMCEKTSQKLGTTFELKPQVATHKSFIKRTCEKTSQKLGATFQLKPQVATHKSFIKRTCEKTSQEIGKTFELKPQSATHQALPEQTCKEAAKKLVKSAEREPLSNSVQECIPIVSNENKMLSIVDFGGLVVEDLVEIKEEIIDSDYENESEVLMHSETSMKNGKAESVGKKPESYVMTIKKEIDSDVDEDALTSSIANDKGTIQKKRPIVIYDDQSRQMFSQPKKNKSI